jgi:hypothetical protein
MRLAGVAVLLHLLLGLVRDRDHDGGARDPEQLRERRAEVGHVLERLAAERDVELAVGVGQVVDVGRARVQPEDLAGALAGLRGQVGGLDARAEQAPHQLGLVALRRPHVHAGAKAQLRQRAHDLERAHVAGQQRGLAVAGVEAVDRLVGDVDAVRGGLPEALVEPAAGLLGVGVHRHRVRAL